MGLPICLKQKPREPGYIKTGKSYDRLLGALEGLPNVRTSWNDMKQITPFITGTEKIDYWCRKTEDVLYIFFANPRAKGLTFPLQYGQSLNDEKTVIPVSINYRGKEMPVTLQFDPYQSLLLKISNDGLTSFIDIRFLPKKPVYTPRVRTGKEKWEVVEPGK